MKATIKLNYPNKFEVDTSEITVVIKVKGYKFSPEVPIEELGDRFWEALPKPLSQKPFEMEISEEELSSALNYLPSIYLRDLSIDWEKVNAEIKALGYTESQIHAGWLRFWHSDMRSEYVYYSKEDAEKELEKMVQEYIDNCKGMPLTGDAITLQVAEETGLEAINLKGEGWCFPKYIDGGSGSGYRVVWEKS